MPGMMDTILNLGHERRRRRRARQEDGQPAVRLRRVPALHRDVRRRRARRVARAVRARARGGARRRREEQGGRHHAPQQRGAASARSPTRSCRPRSCEKIVAAYKAVVKKETGKDFPTDPHEQLWGAIDAVFHSWKNHRAIVYRRMNDIPDDVGDGVHHPVDGLRQPRRHQRDRRRLHARPVDRREAALRRVAPERAGGGRRRGDPHAASAVVGREATRRAGELARAARCRRSTRSSSAVADKLETHFRDVQDIEFTVQAGKLYILQCRSGEADRARRGADRRRDGQGGAHHARRRRSSASTRRPSTSSCIPTLDPSGPEEAPRARASGEPRRGAGAHRLQRRRSRAARRSGQARHPGPHRDVARRHPRHEGGARRHHGARRHDEPRGGGRARHGEGVHRGLLGDQRELRGADDDHHGLRRGRQADRDGDPEEGGPHHHRRVDRLALRGGGPDGAGGARRRVRRADGVGRQGRAR